MNTIGERIREIRKLSNLSGEKFGEKIGLSRAAISNMENGARDVTDQTVISICREFNVREEWLRTGEGEPYNEPDFHADIARFANALMSEKSDSLKVRLMTAMASLTTEEWELAEKVIREIKGL